ncbi:hypothetical protein HPP92_012938 [Vanilla planifolia]|uniref:FRIGIDA-like protein n=1 Tax=Vanilla planifolia TaxID=51239 RepID=A0A835QT50_VANPL|nr:hypothetical protein HPP92_012938 [Vanilla planifolia]
MGSESGVCTFVCAVPDGGLRMCLRLQRPKRGGRGLVEVAMKRGGILLAEQEAAVVTKEQALSDRLQVLKAAAVLAVIEARKKHKEAFPVLQNKISSLPNEVPNHARDGNITINKLSNLVEAFTGKVKPLPQLKKLCEQMDLKGPVKFIAENRKILPTIREELPHALRSACEPTHLVLDCFRGILPSEPIQLKSKFKG